jgi:hypothetical protein
MWSKFQAFAIISRNVLIGGLNNGNKKPLELISEG